MAVAPFAVHVTAPTRWTRHSGPTGSGAVDPRNVLLHRPSPPSGDRCHGVRAKIRPSNPSAFGGISVDARHSHVRSKGQRWPATNRRRAGRPGDPLLGRSYPVVTTRIVGNPA